MCIGHTASFLFSLPHREEEKEMLELITNINSTLNGIVWGWPALILLAFVGVLTTCITK